jgi:hypothetical protein
MRKILYFRGAGLSKSLQVPGKPIPMMLDFVGGLADYLSDNVILTTLARLETNTPYPYRWKSRDAARAAKERVRLHCVEESACSLTD